MARKHELQMSSRLDSVLQSEAIETEVAKFLHVIHITENNHWKRF